MDLIVLVVGVALGAIVVLVATMVTGRKPTPAPMPAMDGGAAAAARLDAAVASLKLATTHLERVAKGLERGAAAEPAPRPTAERVERRLTDNAYTDTAAVRSPGEPQLFAAPTAPPAAAGMPVVAPPTRTSSLLGDWTSERADPVEPPTPATPALDPIFAGIERSYSAMIAQGSREAFDEWTRANRVAGAARGGSDGGYVAGPLQNARLIIVELDHGAAAVLPGWDIIEGFSTDYAQVRTMPQELRDAFELTVDTTGRMSIDAAARLTGGPGEYKLLAKGCLAGLTS